MCVFIAMACTACERTRSSLLTSRFVEKNAETRRLVCDVLRVEGVVQLVSNYLIASSAEAEIVQLTYLDYSRIEEAMVAVKGRENVYVMRLAERPYLDLITAEAKRRCDSASPDFMTDSVS